MSRRWGWAGLLVVLTIAVYIPALSAGFIWDDDVLLTENLLVRTTSGLGQLWIPSKTIDYYPVTWTSFWIEYRLWGLDATGYHVTNILLHILGALLVWQILERLRVRGAWFAALLFAIHPVNVESVAWIAERKNTLSLVFYALTVLYFLRDNRRSDWIAVGMFLLALLSKTAGVMLPAVLLLCSWWQRGTIHRRDLFRTIPFFALAAVFAAITLWSQSWATGSGAAIDRSLVFRLGAAGHVFWFYLFKAIAPVRLMAVYPLWNFDSPGLVFWLPTFSAGAVLAVGWGFRKTWGNAGVFGLVYFGLMLFPVLGILNAPYSGRSPVVTDHLQYLALIGIVSLVAAGLTKLPAPVRLSLGVAIVLLFGVLTWQRAVVHQDQEKLWTDTLAKNPAAGKAHFMLGVVYEKRRDFEAAITHYQAALQLNSNTATVHNNLANTLAKLGRRAAALPHYAEAIRLKPNFPDAQRNWANALSQSGQHAAAIPHYTAALQLNPADAQAHNNLGVALAAQQQLPEACRHFTEAARLEPGNSEFRDNLAKCRQAGQ
ncbi:MAG: tetratricopeptide repeat protein [Verrucomicrobiota bacterium]